VKSPEVQHFSKKRTVSGIMFGIDIAKLVNCSINCLYLSFGCNDNIKGVGNLSSPGCNEINVMSLFNTIPRTKRSHGHKRIQHPNVKKSSKPRTLQYTFNDLLSNIQKPLEIHHIRTILFSLPVNYLKDLRDFGLDKGKQLSALMCYCCVYKAPCKNVDLVYLSDLV
jgi:hypothetical protein